MKPAQRTGWNALRPEDERASATTAQYLLRRPECICCLLRPDVKEAFQPQPDVGEPQAVRQMGWLDQRDGPVAQRTERGAQEPHLADARLLNQQVDQATERPAAARKLGGERRVTRIHHAPAAASELGRPPQGRMDFFGADAGDRHGDGNRPVYLYSMLAQNRRG